MARPPAAYVVYLADRTNSRAPAPCVTYPRLSGMRAGDPVGLGSFRCCRHAGACGIFPAHHRAGLKNFRELYCEQHRIPLDRYERDLVWRSLHRRARPFYWLLGLISDYTLPDYDFVRGVGELRNRREFRNEAAEYHYHPRNRGFLRSVLKLRVSSHRLQKIFEDEIEEHGSRPPL